MTRGLAGLAPAALLAILVACGSAPEPPAPRPAAVASENPTDVGSTDSRVRLDLCFDNAHLYGRGQPAYRALLDELLARMRALDLEVTGVMVGPCATYGISTIVGCYGVPGVLACRTDDLGKLAMNAGFYDALLSRHAERAQVRYQRSGAFAPGDAVFGLLQLRSSDTAAEVQDLQRQWIASDLGLTATDVDELIREAEAFPLRLGSTESLAGLGTTAFRVMLTFLLGHEAFHLRGDRCVDEQRAFTEENGFFTFATESTTNRQLFCREPAATAELRGDRCGLRALRSRVPGQPAENATIVAAEVLAWTLTTRFGYRVVPEPKAWVSVPLSGYMHPVLRTALVSEEILSIASVSRPALCDRLGRNAIIAIQKEYELCSEQSQGDVDDQLLARLPPGASQGWSTGPWRDPESFWCPP